MNARLRLRSLPWLVLASACGSAPPTASPVPPALPRAVQITPTTPGPSLVVLSGAHAFREAIWLPSGVLLAHSQRELWLVSPNEPDRARVLHFDSDITAMAVSEHDDTAAVATLDRTVSLVRDLQVIRTFPGNSVVAGAVLWLSPDGKLLARNGPRAANGADQLEVLEIESGKPLFSLANTGNLSFDPTSHYVSNHQAVFDIAGTQRYRLSEPDSQRLFSSDWVGPRVGYVGERVLRLVDPSTGKTKNVDIACKNVDAPASELTHAGRFLRACGNRFMLVDGASGTLTRIKLPTAASADVEGISPRGAGYVVSLQDDQQAHVDVDTGKAHLETGTWRRVDDEPVSVRHGEQWVDTRSGTLAVRRADTNALVAGWGGGLEDADDQPFRPTLGLLLRVRDGALEVTNRANPRLQTDPFLHRFGPAAPDAPPLTPPSECQTGGDGMRRSFYSTLDLRPVSGRNDAACICLDSGCDVRPFESGWEPLAATRDDLLYLKSSDAATTSLARVGKDGTREVTVDGYCPFGVIAADRRAYVGCFVGGTKGKPSARKGLRKDAAMQLVELGATDLAVAGTREIGPGFTGAIMSVVGDELALSETGMNAVSYLFPQGKAGCSTDCNMPVATVSTWSTFSVLERNGSVRVAGKEADAARAVICIDGNVVTPWATCRK